MKSNETTVSMLLTHQERETDTFRPPSMKVVAHDLGVPLLTFRNWYHAFRLRTGSPDWYGLNEGTYVAFHEWMELAGLTNG